MLIVVFAKQQKYITHFYVQILWKQGQAGLSKKQKLLSKTLFM